MLIEWDIKVHAYEHAFIFQIKIADGEFCHAFFRWKRLDASAVV